MMRYRTATLATLALMACGGPPPEAPAEPAPDLILVVVDTLRADHLSGYGYPRNTSPHVDQLAARGVRFTDNTSQSSWTLPSMTSLLTGRLMFVNAHRLPLSVPSLAERLADAGYETAAFVANPNLTRSSGFARGFQHFVTRDDTGGDTWDASDLQAALFDWLAAHPRGAAPRFFYLHYLDPHWPYEPDPAQQIDGQPALRDDTIEAWLHWIAGLEANEGAQRAQRVRQAFNRDRLSILADMDRYDREIATVDASLARVLEALDAGPRLVLLAADHGEGLWDHQHYPKVVAEALARERREPASATLADAFFRDHSYHLYQELIHTPLILAGQGFPAGLVIDTPVQNVDIVPTLLRAAGLPDDPALDGQPLQDLLNGAAPAPFVSSHAKEGTVVRRTSDDAKLIFPSATGDWFGMPMMLFDLRADPHERHNRLPPPGDRSATSPAIQDTLRALIHQREQQAAAFHLFDGEDPEAVDDEALRAMRELGYIGAGFEERDGR